MYAQKLSFDYAHTLHTVRIVHNAHSVHRSRVPNRQSCDCITFVMATDPACGSGGMFVQTGDFVNEAGLQANNSMTFYGQEKVEYNAKLCLMNMAVHGLTGVIKSGDEANTFYHDAHNLEGKCNYVMANEAVICGLTPEKACNFKEFAA